jgi:uncharacterized protein (DUF305 family)
MRTPLPALALALVLSGCAAAPEAASSGGGITGQVCCAPAQDAAVVDGVDTAHDGWDNAFIAYLAPHDAVASQMAEMALTQAVDPQVKDIARAIDAVPQQRYLKLSAMAAAWGQPAPSTDPAAAGGHDHGGGRTEAADVESLVPLTGPAFDRQFLDVFVRHHQAGIKVAQDTVDNGTNPQAKEVAQDLVTVQTAELAQLQQLQQNVGKP